MIGDLQPSKSNLCVFTGTSNGAGNPTATSRYGISTHLDVHAPGPVAYRDHSPAAALSSALRTSSPLLA
jgi:hypothetical protein